MPLKIEKNSAPGAKHSCNVSNVVCEGDFIVTGSDDGKIKIWKPDLEFVSEMETPGGILSLAACDDVLYTCSTDGSIRSWDLKTGKNTSTFSSSLYQPQKLFADKSASVLWAGDSQGNVAKYEKGVEVAKFELVEEIWDLMTRGNLVYTARDRDVVVAELMNGSQKARVAVKATHPGRSPFCIAGSNFCFLSRDGRKVQVHKNAVEEKFPRLKEFVASDLIVNALAPAGDNHMCTGGYDSIVKKWDLKSSECLGSVNLGCCINALACRSENEAYVARSDGTVTKIAG